MRAILIVFLSITLASCGQIGAIFKSTGHFTELESDQRIHYETMRWI